MAGWTPPASDADWTPPAGDADDTPPREVGPLEENLVGPSEVLGGMVAGFPHAVAHSGVDLYRRWTGGDLDAPDPAAVQALEPTHYKYFPSAAGKKLTGDIAKLPIISTDLQKAKEADTEIERASPTAHDVLHHTTAVVGDVGNIAGGAGLVKGGVESMINSAVDRGMSTSFPKPGPETTPPPAPVTGVQVTGDSLRAQPDPIPPPEGTVAAAKTLEAAAARANNPFRFANGTMKETPKLKVPPRAATVNPAPAVPQTAGEIAGAPPAEMQGPVGSLDSTIAAQSKPKAAAPERIFNSPKEEGPQETPAPEEQARRAASLDALDDLSGKGLPNRRASAVSGDYNATGNDWQDKETGSKTMEAQVASENAALHAATAKVHKSIGSDFPDSVDPTTVSAQGRVTRGAIQGIESHFDQATNDLYDQARATNGDKPLPGFLTRVKSFLNDDANYMPEGFRKSALARLNQLETVGDHGLTGEQPAAPGSVGAAEKFRQWLNSNRTLDNMHTTRQLVDHTDMDVADHGGPGLFQAARDMKRHAYQMLEEPTGIRKLLTPADSSGINHAIPEHKVMDYIAELPREQHEHLMNVLRSSAHLGDGELAESSAAAIREIQAHTVSRLHDAAMDDGGKWNARGFYSAANRYGRNAASAFADRPDVIKNLKTVNDAGNALHMDRHYPGAVGQGVRSTALGHVIEAGGNVASSLVHHIPLVGRITGKAIEAGVEGLGGKISEATREKAVASRIVDRNGTPLAGKSAPTPTKPLGARAPGNQRGAVGDLSQRDAIEHETSELPGYRASKNPSSSDVVHHRYKVPSEPGSLGPAGQMHVTEYPERGVSQVSTSRIVPSNRGQGWGTRMLQRAADDAHARGQVLRSDSQVSDGAVGAYKNLKTLGYDVQMKPNDHLQGAYHAVGDHVFEVRPRKEGGPIKVPSSQRGSFSFQNDNVLNRATAGPRNSQRGGSFGERNPRTEYNANRQLAGNQEMTPERADILRRMSGQTGATGNVGKQSTAGMRSKQGGGSFGGAAPDEAPRTAEEGSQLNIGLHQGTEGGPGFKKMSKQEAQAAVESTGAKVTKSTVLTPKAHGVAEPTAVLSTDRPLTDHEMQGVLAKTKQSAIPQRTGQGDESMHIAPGHEQTAKEQGWDQFSPDYFREHSGQTMTDAANGPTTEPASPYPPHPAATVKDAKQSKFPGIYDDPKEIMQRLGAGSPESKHLQDIFGVTRKDLHDTAVGRGDVEPKTPIPGITQKGAGSAHADNIKTPENAQRLRDIIQAYKEHDPSGYHGMVGWYEMDPMYHSIKKILGGSEEAAAKVYHNLNSMTAYASPMSPVGTEIRRGTAAATMAAEGNFDQFARHGNLPQSRAPEALKAKNFELGNEGTMAHGSQAPAMGRFLETGQEANAVKTGTYRRSSDAPSRPGSDYQNTQPVGDSHWSRGAGLADVRGAKGFEGSATGTEMKTLGKWYHDTIARHPDIDLPSTSAQAVQWGALSKETGVDSPIGAPKLEIWANQIASAADRAGISPKEMWKRIIKRLAT